jgi:hypothetical protein
MSSLTCSTIDTSWPVEEPDDRLAPDEIDGDTPLELDSDYWDALLPDDDYEPFPEHGDFWPDDEEE